MDDIKIIYEMLNWKNTENMRAEGFRLAREIKDLSLLIFPPAEASVWESCAQILCEKEDMILEPYLDSLLEWLSDLDWPGALLILERLKVFSGEKLINPFISCFTLVCNLNNTEGQKWLANLSELLDNTELKERLEKTIIEKLNQSRICFENNQGMVSAKPE